MRHLMIPLFLMMCIGFASTPVFACSTAGDEPDGCEGYDEFMSSLSAGVIVGAALSVGGFTAFLYSGSKEEPYGKEVLNHYIQNNPVAVQSAIMTGTGQAVHDLAFILGSADAASLGRRMRAKRAILLPLVHAQVFDAARFHAQLGPVS